MENESIIDKILRTQEFKNKLAKAAGLVLALSICVFPTLGYLSLRSFNKADLENRLEVANRLIDKVNTSSSAKKVLGKYLSENSDLIDKLPETYDTLSKLQWVVSVKDSINLQDSQVSLEQKVIIDGASRIDIGTNSYFSEFPLSQQTAFLPEINLVLDKSNNTLYSLDSQKQRVVEPIKEVSKIVHTLGGYYMLQGSSVFKIEKSIKIKVQDSVPRNGLQCIEGSPFAAVFSKTGNKILGDIPNEYNKDAQKINASLELLKGKFPYEGTKIVYDGDFLFFNSSSSLFVLNGSQKSFLFDCNETDSRLIDYAVLIRGMDKKRRTSLLYTEKIEKGFFHDSRVYGFFVNNSLGIMGSYIPVKNDCNPDYRFPSQLNSSDFRWIDPISLKRDVKRKLGVSQNQLKIVKTN